MPIRLLKSGLPLEHFPLALLQTTLGWDEAFAQTISDLEGGAFWRPLRRPPAPGDRPRAARSERDRTRSRAGRRRGHGPCRTPRRGERAITALNAERHFRPLAPDLQIEYAVAGLAEGGRLLSGYVDLVGATAERLDVIDCKTDAPPLESAVRNYPEYVAQVRAYGALLAAGGAARDRAIGTGLLFSADVTIHWV